MAYSIDPTPPEENEGATSASSLQAQIFEGKFECPVCSQMNKCEQEGEIKCEKCKRCIFAYN